MQDAGVLRPNGLLVWLLIAGALASGDAVTDESGGVSQADEPEPATPAARRCFIQSHAELVNASSLAEAASAAGTDQDLQSTSATRAPQWVRRFLAWLRTKWYWILIFVCIAFGVGVPVAYHHLRNLHEERTLFLKMRMEDQWQGRGQKKRFVPAQMLDYIKIDPDGGLDRIKELMPGHLWNIKRCLLAAGHLGMFVFNVSMIFQTNVDVVNVCLNPMGYAKYEGITCLAHGDPANRNMQHPLITKVHAVTVALAELFCCAFLIMVMIYRFLAFTYDRRSEDSHYDAYIAMYEAFDMVKIIESFSCLKLSASCHPALIPREFEISMANPFFGKSKSSMVAQAVGFVLLRMAAMLASIVAFAVKLVFVSQGFHNRTHETFWKWMLLCQLLCQTVSALLVERLLRERILLIVSGGSDGIVEPEEAIRCQVYISRISERIWKDYWVAGRHLAFLVLFLTFDDRDLQKLLFEEDEKLRKKREKSLKDFDDELTGSGSLPRESGGVSAKSST